MEVAEEGRLGEESRWKGKKGMRRSSETLSGEGEVSAINCLGWGKIGVLSWSSAKTEEDPGKVIKPVSIGSTGMEGGFQAVVKTLNQTVGLRMIGGGRLMMRRRQRWCDGSLVFKRYLLMN